MPKLDTPTAKRVNASTGSAFTVVDEDQYRIRLEKVAVAPKPDKNGNVYWIWDFEIVSGQTTGDKFKGKNVRTQTGFTENQVWFAKMVFDAFGVKPNVDTDTLLGHEVLAIVGQSEITQGSRRGQMRNEVQTVTGLDAGGDDDDWSDETPGTAVKGETPDTGTDDGEGDDPDF